MSSSLVLALALLLIIEGAFPFLSPTGWRDTFRKIAGLPPQTIRIGGFVAMALGLALLLLVT